MSDVNDSDVPHKLPPGGKDMELGTEEDQGGVKKDLPQLPPEPEKIDFIEHEAKELAIDIKPAVTDDTVDLRKRYHENNGNLQLLMAFAIVIMADANQQEGLDDDGIDREAASALGIASASFILAFGKYFVSFFESDVKPAVEIFIAFLLIIVWTVGVIFLTFQNDAIFFQISSGFFATWASLLVSGNYFFSTAGKLGEDDDNEDDETNIGKKKTKVTDGLNGYFGVGLILTISTIAAGALAIGETPNRARAVSLIVFTTPLTAGLLVMNFLPFKTYKDPFYFMFTVGVLLVISFINVLTTLLGEPFAQRREEGVIGQPPFIVANGFFSVLATFVVLALVFWKSHALILLYNADNANDPRLYANNIQGRYIWLFLLFISSIVVLAAAATECSNFESCDDNGFIGPLIAISFLQAFAAPLVFCVSTGNPDFGDMKVSEPDTELEIAMTTSYRVEFVSALLFFGTWIASASTFTFGVTSPFNTASAGFFFIWLATFFSAMYFSSVFPKFGLFNMTFFKWQPPNGMKPEHNFGYGLILCGSIIQIAAVIIALYQDIENEGVQSEHVLTLVLQGLIILLLIMLVFMSPKALGVCALINAYLLIAFTFAILLITTVFANPFDTAQLGNGFFAAWISVYGSFFAYNHYEWDLPPLEA